MWLPEGHVVEAETVVGLRTHWTIMGVLQRGAVPGCWEPHFGARRTLNATLSLFLVLAGLCRMPVLGSQPFWGLGDTGGQTLETPTSVGDCFLQGGEGPAPRRTHRGSEKPPASQPVHWA